MQVIQEGRKQQGWAKEYECTGRGNGGGGCGAILRVEEADLFATTSSIRDEIEYCVTFRCCSCGVLTDIKKSDVPYSIVNKLVLRNPV